jgi:hypothetical protein
MTSTITTTPQAAKDLRAAADLIRKGGLAKGSFYRRPAGEDTSYCTVGAIVETHGDYILSFMDSPALVKVRELLGIVDPAHPWIAIARWNDQPERTDKDVITLLEQAAEKLEAEW